MAKHRASGDDQLTRQGVIETPGAAYWSVDDSRWPTVRPDLPAHVADLLAPPIVVGVARVPVTSRLTPPADDASADAPAPTDPGSPVLESLPPVPVVAALVPSAPVLPSAAAPAEPAPPPPAPTTPRPVPTPPLSPRPVPSPPPERPVPGPPASPRRAVNTGPAVTGRRGNGGPTTAGRHRRGASDRAS
ncbi:hypothetical protein C7C45_30075 [Micromonospora arborensis]|uniref:Uncharacterized protein n=1 Tax=Micromonospora arborensis TaxID=2116518 RepID=A0A318NEY9_9ACTN|nr:hypothetical protein [Micromonospora arborensis]PYC64722.1 hypothetical protein C7C45_30075 [Micromonospora arborensis]